eukprot:1161950-Pelagomonas_calceolata.AAC.1
MGVLGTQRQETPHDYHDELQECKKQRLKFVLKWVMCPEGAHRPFWPPFRPLEGPGFGHQRSAATKSSFSSSTQCKSSFLSKE